MTEPMAWLVALLVSCLLTLRFWLRPDAELALLTSAVFTLVIIVLMVTAVLI